MILRDLPAKTTLIKTGALQMVVTAKIGQIIGEQLVIMQWMDLLLSIVLNVDVEVVEFAIDL